MSFLSVCLKRNLLQNMYKCVQIYLFQRMISQLTLQSDDVCWRQVVECISPKNNSIGMLWEHFRALILSSKIKR